jgi:hypothetical protein
MTANPVPVVRPEIPVACTATAIPLKLKKIPAAR